MTSHNDWVDEWVNWAKKDRCNCRSWFIAGLLWGMALLILVRGGI
jgi:hypothetical protein